MDSDDEIQIIEDQDDTQATGDTEDNDSGHQEPLPKIKIDMTNIPTATCDDDDDELAGLGVTVYNQSQYEQGVMNQIDVALQRETPKSKGKKANDVIQETDFTTVDLTKIDHRPGIRPSTSRRDDTRSPSVSDSGEEWNPQDEIDLVSDEEEAEEEEGQFDDGDDDDGSDFDPEEDQKGKKRKRPVAKLKVKSVKKVKSSYEVEGEVEEQQSSSTEVQLKKHKKIKDDGNEICFRKRLKRYHDELLKEKQAKGCQGEEIDDFDIVDEENDFKVPHKIWSQLYPYQQACVKWLWQLHQACVGGIIGDEMGLGKTIQVIAFLAGLKCSKVDNFRETFKTLGPTIIICPATVMHQWVAEIHKWFPPLRVAILHSSGSYSGSKNTLIRLINKAKGILITTYSCINDYQDYLIPLDWHYVILDEGHKIRNPDAQVTLAVKRFRTPHRIILSGSPIQNNLRELWSLFDFIYPGKLGTLPVFNEQFSIPITQGGYSNASDVQVKIAFRCATVLRDTIKPYLLRRMKEDVKEIINLPGKNEQVLFCRLTDEQRKLYQSYLDTPEIKEIIKGSNQMFVGLINLRKICNHPDLFIGAKTLTNCKSSNLAALYSTKDGEDESESFGFYKKSGKMHVVDALLKLWQKQRHKVLFFTQGTQMMEIIEKYLKFKNYSYLRLDGSTAIGQRQNLISTFNSNKDIFIFLLTTRVGGIGVNLTSASRVLIYDPDWNPSTDMQARERAWRIGQEQQVTIYRLLTAGTIEEKIYQRQVFKQYLTNKVLKDPKQRRFFKTKDLYELFSLASDEGQTECSAIFAGTGSEVSRPQNSSKEKNKHKTNEAGTINNNEKQQQEQRGNKDKGASGNESERRSRERSSSTASVVLPPEKIEELRERAKRLSQMLAAKFNGKSSNGTGSVNQQSTLSIECSSESKKSNEKVADGGAGQLERTKYKDEEKVRSKESKSKKNSNYNNTLKVKQGVKFEGKRIKYLVKKNSLAGNSMEEQKSGKLSEKQDEYVLKKLFKKSSTAIHSAIQHDVIEAASNPDFALVEAEAEKVAEEAIEALKRSRTNCFPASSGIPNWTGASGSMRKQSNSSGKPSFGRGVANPPSSSSTGSSSNNNNNSNSISSSNLLGSIKMRNRVHAESPVDPFNGAPLDTDHNELLGDLRSFIAFQATRNGEAGTEEILNKFRHRIPTHQTPVFKALLWKICDFYRKPDGSGVWKLKYEFIS